MRYDHALLEFSARERNGTVELVIRLKDNSLGLHTYYAPVHERDINFSRNRTGASSFTMIFDSKSRPAENPKYSCVGRA